MKFEYITIEREYGAGATEIGQRLGEKTGTQFFGKEILELAADKMNTNIEQIYNLEEKSVGSLMYTLAMVAGASKGTLGSVPDHVKLYSLENQIIKDIASDTKAIFVGHFASAALKERHDVLNVFIRSNYDDRKNRVITQYGVPQEDAKNVIERMDRRRQNYYFSNIGKKMHDASNYGLILDSSILGIQKCVDILAECMRG